MGDSIATKLGDRGQTGLVGGSRVWKSDARVEAYGNVDELNSVLGFARSICTDEEIREKAKAVQKELFTLGAVLATPGISKSGASVTEAMVDALTEEVHRIEKIEGILSDWSLPGEHTAAAAFDIARTVCRRAERGVVHLMNDPQQAEGTEKERTVLAYLNRLSDVLWLWGRLLELRAGVEARLRDKEHEGPRWSKAW